MIFKLRYYQYLNFARCLTANAPSSNTTVGLDPSGFLFFNINTTNPDHSTYVFRRCRREYAESILAVCGKNGSRNRTMINATHISNVQNGSDLFLNCAKPIPTELKDEIAKKYKLLSHYTLLS
ncbi:hypothetical protein BN7_5184 [Wickerhamomyces ciferrii]|uniref:Uncharacterized protein n=1 Tax=Wickerhamomyces ciferrii (strain ATCC 14091 / BCRC 22168 / CBS 111 / JCM 3599 / NBRC 0793 / NRRL Y-1031 F-60-10) TaxID=1206466 RepID=K0KR35_WICCF|nr:uncharacterized protein BN7_5184 [Wickerhamomyces ciferrii]CCH45601.1 hypothetical protein BN7_5184 [Wickerhamomyces ciferrii]